MNKPNILKFNTKLINEYKIQTSHENCFEKNKAYKFNTFSILSNINICKNTRIYMVRKMKSIKKFINEESGQGAAEYILLFGGVIVIALLALTIYRSYMETSDRSLKAKDDIIDVRNTILDNRTHV
jgi:hypothetical protein